MISLHPLLCPCLPAGPPLLCSRNPHTMHNGLLSSSSPMPPTSSLPPLQSLYFLFRSNLRGSICQMYRFPIKAQYLYSHQGGDICVCLHACNPGRTACREGCVHECARVSVWVHFIVHRLQGVKYPRSSWMQDSHQGDMNEVKHIIPVTHHILSAHAASGLPAPGPGHFNDHDGGKAENLFPSQTQNRTAWPHVGNCGGGHVHCLCRPTPTNLHHWSCVQARKTMSFRDVPQWDLLTQQPCATAMLLK